MRQRFAHAGGRLRLGAIFLPVVAGVLLLAAGPAWKAKAAQGSDTVSLVNPFIGTSGTQMGGPIDTFPGATMPFGMIAWSPDTPSMPAGGGYDYGDHEITGFSLTHLSGPGCKFAHLCRHHHVDPENRRPGQRLCRTVLELRHIGIGCTAQPQRGGLEGWDCMPLIGKVEPGARAIPIGHILTTS